MSLNIEKISRTPGIYIFQDKDKKPLYVGRATDLRSRVRSYFSNRILADRGPRIHDAIKKTKHIKTLETDSVLDAYILEANLIKKYSPPYNVIDKDNKSFQFVCITDEEYPRVITVRGRELELGKTEKCKYVFGPFPRGGLLKEALKVVRKILPYRDTCTPFKLAKSPRACFRSQLNLCPGVCSGVMNKKEYNKRIQEIKLLFEGKKKILIKNLEKDMKAFAKEREFEKADEVKKRIFSLTHIRDITLISHDAHTVDTSNMRIEAYDVAHLNGKDTIGVMVVLLDGELVKSKYRTFCIKEAAPGDDIGALKEILNRRLQHPEWAYPKLIVVDGGKAHINAANKVIKNIGLEINIVSVVKTENHTPREVLGSARYKTTYEKDIILANSEAHRFALYKHTNKRTKSLLS